MSHTGLPDSDTARRTISETVTAFGPPMAQQACAHAESVSQFLDWRRLRASPKEAKSLIRDLIGPHGSNSYHGDTWFGGMSHILSGFYPVGDPVSWDPGGIKETLYPALQTLDNKGDGWLDRASTKELRPVLSELHRCLVTLGGNLAGSVPPPPLLPAHHPPEVVYLSLEEDRIASMVEEFARLIEESRKQYAAAGEGGWRDSSREYALTWRIELSFYPIGGEVLRRYTATTHGFKHLEMLAGERQASGLSSGMSYSEEYREIAGGIHHRIHSSYVAIAANYLAEVLKLMPDYEEASKPEPRRDPVTVYGNVGAINSQVHSSHLAVGDTVTSIGATINTIAARGETDTAEALRALTEAIQHAPELAQDRAELLYNVADVADAAAAPDEPRKLSRARAAMAMITTAAGTSTQLASAVDAWRQVAGQLF